MFHLFLMYLLGAEMIPKLSYHNMLPVSTYYHQHHYHHTKYVSRIPHITLIPPNFKLFVGTLTVYVNEE